MCVYMYTCMCAGIYNVMMHYIYMYVYMYMYRCTYVCIYIYMYIRLVKTCFIKALLRLH